ncbi:hypothetical protein GCM10009828_006080 [Actinoplanes couchii]
MLTMHLIRAVPWWPFAGAVVLALVVQAPVFRASVLRTEADPRMTVIGLLLAAAVLGAAAGFALPDLMTFTVITPVARWRRQWLRLAVLLVPATLIWVLLYAGARIVVGPAAIWPDGFVILQAAVCGLLPVAAAAIGARYRVESIGGLFGPTVQGVAMVVSLFFTERSSPWPFPVTAEWTTAQRCWPFALVLILAMLLLANREMPPRPIGFRRAAGRPLSPGVA